MQLSLFHSLVNPILCYASEVWGYAEAKKVEVVQLKFLKMILKVRKNTPSCIVYRECQVYPLYLSRLFRLIKYWLKIIDLNENDPIKILYKTTLMINGNTASINTPDCWGHQIRKILYLNGFGYIWENQDFGVNKHFFSTFKKRLIDSFWQSNNTDIHSLSNNRLYRHLTVESCSYIKTFSNDFIRIAITKLRLGSHHLNIERGRWYNTLLADRKCTICNDIEDELHFVVICTQFYDLRKKYLPKSLYTNPSMYKFLKFINSNDENQIKKTWVVFTLCIQKIYI